MGPQLALAQRALDIAEMERGQVHAQAAIQASVPGSPGHIYALTILGTMQAGSTQPEKAAQTLASAYEAAVAACGPDHPLTGSVLVSRSQHHLAVGRLEAAVTDLNRALEVAVAAGDARQAALRRAGLAHTRELLSDDPLAEGELNQALEVLEGTDGPDSIAVAGVLRSRARLLTRRGRPDAALADLRRAAAIAETAYDLGHPERAATLRQFGVALEAENPALAETIVDLSYTVHSRILGAEHPAAAADLRALAGVVRRAGRTDDAERYLWRAMGIVERTLGPGHPDTADIGQELALLRALRNDHAAASALMHRVADTRLRVLGPDHPSVADARWRLTALAAARGDNAEALALASQASEARDRAIETLLPLGSEREKLRYLATLSEEANRAVALHALGAPHEPTARRLALHTVLTRKGRVLDAMAEQLAGADSEEHAELHAVRAELAGLVLRGTPATRPQRDALAARAEALERGLGGQATRRLGADVVERVQAALPAGSALVELWRLTPPPAYPEGPASEVPARYIAYVLRPERPVAHVDLGPADAIDSEVRLLLRDLSDSGRELAHSRSERVHRLLVEPLAPALAGADRVLLSPDGMLHLVPFGALSDGETLWLERTAIALLTSGRDLLSATGDRPRGGALIIADPDYGAPPSGPLPARRQRSADLAAKGWDPLPDTAAEARAIDALLPDATVLLGAEATEGALAAARSPVVLHLATHGFFLAGSPQEGVNPLLWSGLVLAGASAPREGAYDGLVTALEASALPLRGTRLVTLSACETGLGVVESGEGVFGLRRAAALAGAESVLMSLWQVDDEITRRLMVQVYENLRAGRSRAESLAQAQLAIRNTEGLSHPYYWAGFTLAGHDGPIEELRP